MEVEQGSRMKALEEEQKNQAVGGGNVLKLDD